MTKPVLTAFLLLSLGAALPNTLDAGTPGNSDNETQNRHPVAWQVSASFQPSAPLPQIRGTKYGHKQIARAPLKTTHKQHHLQELNRICARYEGPGASKNKPKAPPVISEAHKRQHEKVTRALKDLYAKEAKEAEMKNGWGTEKHYTKWMLANPGKVNDAIASTMRRPNLPPIDIKIKKQPDIPAFNGESLKRALEEERLKEHLRYSIFYLECCSSTEDWKQKKAEREQHARDTWVEQAKMTGVCSKAPQKPEDWNSQQPAKHGIDGKPLDQPQGDIPQIGSPNSAWTKLGKTGHFPVAMRS